MSGHAQARAGHPSMEISSVTNNLPPTARPALNADRTAAAAIDRQSTTAARGARSSHEARASTAGTGPTNASASTAKVSADTQTVSLS